MTSTSPLFAAESFRQVLSQGPYDQIIKLLDIVGRESPQLINILTRDACLHSSGHVELPVFFGCAEDLTPYSIYSFWTMVSLLEVKPLWFHHLESFSQDGAPRDEDFRFPPGLVHCPVLRSLTIRNAGLVELPSEILKIRRLKGLDVSSNRIRLLPPGIGSLRQLVYFNASGNDLKTLPPQLSGLRKLQILNLSGNRIESLGFSLDALAGLKRLNLSGNCLETLPLGLNALNQLERIQLAYNDLCADDEAVWEAGDFSQIPGHQWHFSF